MFNNGKIRGKHKETAGGNMRLYKNTEKYEYQRIKAQGKMGLIDYAKYTGYIHKNGRICIVKRDIMHIVEKLYMIGKWIPRKVNRPAGKFFPNIRTRKDGRPRYAAAAADTRISKYKARCR